MSPLNGLGPRPTLGPPSPSVVDGAEAPPTGFPDGLSEILSSGAPAGGPDPAAAEAARQQMRDAGAAQRAAIEASGFDLSGFADADLVAGHLATLGASDRAQTEASLRRAAGGPNAERALGTYEALIGHPAINERERRILTDGVATPRSDGPRGQAGVLSPNDARVAADSLGALEPGERARVTNLLDQAGRPGGRRPAGASPSAEQALILKAVGARAPQMPGGSVEGLDDVEAFAEDIRGLPRDELMRTTTLTDVHEANTQAVDPNRPWIGATDDRGDNDALPQAFTHSCAPTVAQIVKGEIDPVYARHVHNSGFEAATDEQRATLERERTFFQGIEVPDGWEAPPGAETVSGLAIDREPADTINGLYGPQIGKLIEAGTIDSSAVDHLKAYAKGQDYDPAGFDAALADLRANGVDIPTELLDQLRTNAETMEAHGSYTGMDTGSALVEIAQRPYIQQHVEDFPDAFDRLADQLDATGHAAIGMQVPGHSSGHAVVATDVRDGPDGRQFLLTDPMTARTAWVSEQALRDGPGLEAFGSTAPYVMETVQFDIGHIMPR
ncbi:MAG: hypothetical protein RIT81_32735 [Deltaproteobacteria bacterium]